MSEKMIELKCCDPQGNIIVHQIWYQCPGCTLKFPNKIFRQFHAFSPAKHSFNGDFINPTVTPSLLHTSDYICHSHVTNGMIEYCGDSQHELAGQNVALPEVPQWLKDEAERHKQDYQ